MKKAKIGIFDSGKGGTTVMAAIKEKLPEAEYFYIGDSKNCPYGEKSDAELMQIVTEHVEKLKDWGADIIVIACNTATTKCIENLRIKYPELKFVGTEPAIKLAAKSGAQKILVMATPGTVESERTAQLLEENQKPEQTIDLLACAGLADVIEKDVAIAGSENKQDLSRQSEVVKKLGKLLEGVMEPEIVVLGCTHYSLIKPEIQKYFPNAKLIDGNAGVARRVVELIG